MSELPTAADVLAHLGWPADDPEDIALAAEHLRRVSDLAHAHTRGRGFHVMAGMWCAAEISAVIIRATARSMTNPASDRLTQAGTLVAQPGSFVGWSLVELATLNSWRVRVG